MAKKDTTTATASAHPDTTTATASAQPDAATVTNNETALAAKGETALAEFDFGEMAGAGMAALPNSLMKVPFLGVLSKNRKGITDQWLDKGKKEPNPLFGHIGDFFHPITEKIYDGSLGFIGVIIGVTEYFQERTPVPENKFKGRHDINSPYVKDGKAKTAAANRAKKDAVPYGTTLTPDESGNLLFQTFDVLMQLQAVVADDGSGNLTLGEKMLAVVSFKKTGIPGLSVYTTAVRGNVTLPNGKSAPPGTIPIMANHFRLTTEAKEGGNNSWHVAMLKPMNGDVSKSITKGLLYEDACAAFKAFAAGEIVADDSTMEAAGGEEDSHGGGGGAAPDPNFKF